MRKQLASVPMPVALAAAMSAIAGGSSWSLGLESVT